ncbi:MAG TPA: gluconokinase [Thermomicrobiales bacterium]|nr:gluconokinase [Thermomicrobiales bacterium]
MPTIDLQSIHPPVVLAIDIGSSSVRALLYDAHGTQIPGSESQHPYRQRMTDDGGSESNPKELVYLAIRCVDDVTALASTAGIRIEGIGITSFWHGLLGLGPDGQPATPVYMWSDKRSGDDATAIAEEVDASEVHQRTGCRIHSSYWPAKIRWWRRTQASDHDAVSHWVSVTDHLAQRLLGNLGTSISMASGTGLLNATTLTWDKPLLDLLGLDATNLPDITDRDDGTTSLTGEFSARWPSLAGVPWFPAIGDGAAANVGAGCVSAGSIALTIGTSAAMRVIVPGDSTAQDTRLPERIWRYRLDRQRQVLGGALSNGGNVTSWLARDLFDQEFGPLTEEAANMPPDSHGLTILPLLAGERSPSWRENATATMHGLRLATTPADIFRAALEATAYRLAAIYDDLAPLANPAHEIHANGAAALGSPLWLRIMADTIGHPINAIDAEAEASARGAALCALNAIGALTNLAAIAPRVSVNYEPIAENLETYRRGRVRQRKLEEAIVRIERA